MGDTNITGTWGLNGTCASDFVPGGNTGPCGLNGLTGLPWFQQHFDQQPQFHATPFTVGPECVEGPMTQGNNTITNYCFASEPVCGNEEEADVDEVEVEEIGLGWGMHVHPTALRAMRASSRGVVQSLLRDKGASHPELSARLRSAPLAITWHDTGTPSPSPQLGSAFKPLPHTKRSRDIAALQSGPSVDWGAIQVPAEAAHVGECDMERKKLRVDYPTMGSAAYGVSKTNTAAPLGRGIVGRHKRGREPDDEEEGGLGVARGEAKGVLAQEPAATTPAGQLADGTPRK